MKSSLGRNYGTAFASRPSRWAWTSGAVALLVLGGGCATERPPGSTVRAAFIPPGAAAPARESASTARMLTTVREKVGAGDFAGAVAVLAQLPADERLSVQAPLIEELIRQDPVKAAQFAVALPRGNAQAEALAHATRARHARDPEATLAWALELEDSSVRLVALDVLATELSTHEPARALARLRELPERPRRLDLIRLTAARWARHDPDAAIAWAENLGDDSRGPVLTSIVFELAQTRPARAADLAARLPEGRERSFVFTSIGRTWIALDPKAAEAWVRGLPRGPAYDAALSGMASATGTIGQRRVDSGVGSRPRNRVVALGASGGGGGGGAGAADIALLPPGPQRDAALRREFEARLAESPGRAASWLSTLPGADLTDEVLRRLAREWVRQDPAAAQTWFDLNVPAPFRRDQILQEARLP